MPPKITEVFGLPKLQLLWDDEGKRAKIIALSGGPLRKGAPAMTSEQMKAVLGDQAALIKEVVVNRIIMRLQTERHPTLTESRGLWDRGTGSRSSRATSAAPPCRKRWLTSRRSARSSLSSRNNNNRPSLRLRRLSRRCRRTCPR